jgi:hypothetical protein
MSTLNPKITNAGLALVPNAQLQGLQVVLTHIALGTGTYYPDGSELALQHEVARFPITNGSGTNPAPNQLQIAANIVDLDPQGRTPNNQWIGEIGLYSDNTLFAVWSRAESALFYKTASFDVPLAYTLDVSALPADSVTVVVNADLAGIASMILQHQSDPDAHPQYLTQGEADLLYVLKNSGPGFGAMQDKKLVVNATTSTTTIDLSLGVTFFKVNIKANTAFQFINAPAGTDATSFTIMTVNDATAGRAVAWPVGTKFAGGINPPRTTTANAVDVWTFLTDDAGATYSGSLAIADDK